MKSTPQKILILHDIRSAQNVGSLFRTADAVGIDMIYLSGITATPRDRFDRPNTQISKTSLGAELTVPWQYVASITELVEQLKKDQVQLIAIEQSSRAVDYKDVSVKYPTAFLLGNEVEGVSEELLQKVDVIAEIPMRGAKESLNVSVAGGIALFRILDN